LIFICDFLLEKFKFGGLAETARLEKIGCVPEVNQLASAVYASLENMSGCVPPDTVYARAITAAERGVSRLLLARCPPTVVWRVVAERVDAIQRHVVGPLAHICQKVSKVCPTVADNNPAVEIVG
jgi:hypothetical protein